MKRSKKGAWHAVLIVLAGCAATALLMAREERTPLVAAGIQALSVETLRVRPSDYQVRVAAWGFVAPRETIDIRPEVPGRVVEVPDHIFSGAPVVQGELLFAIDARDYRNTLAEAVAATEQARQALAIEKGRQTIARTEWQWLVDSGWPEDRDNALVLRAPQHKAQQAAVRMASARQARAALDVERTRIAAPCRGVILTEDLARGQVLEKGTMVARLACTDGYRILALFSPEYLLDPGSGAAVEIGSKRYQGVVKAVLPGIDLETRQKQALVELCGVQVPLGAYAKLTLHGPFFRNVTVVPKEALRSGSTVWVFSPDRKLEIRAVTILAQDMDNAVIGEGIAGNEEVILSHIACPLQGMDLRRTPPIVPAPADRTGKKVRGK